ncbi:hypothetical protein [Microseira wollei]|uniref:Uncharacterized protein n=1 Tax=Microseira wollei NIES-4236 TaxID=2530354 RepID=A0AAV3XMR8_9CYAN|nr:hypothetical protein [Microseira wollei]GET40842.1 hypothetical protein MiSe_56540 [Microseira wollei NIES-4236]
MRKYIIFQAERRSPNWKERKFQHTLALTDILAEHYDCSDKPIPQPGYRPLEFIRVDQLHDPKQHGHSTHYRTGDWEVTRVESYTPDVPTPHSQYDMVVICHCKYNPINAPLKPMPERQVSIDSFGGDKEAYQNWLESDKQPTEV